MTGVLLTIPYADIAKAFGIVGDTAETAEVTGATTQLGERTGEEYAQYAIQATHNPSSDTVVLGKFSDPESPSYVKVAERMQATYFSMSNWNEVQAKVGAENMWNINEQFLKRQMSQGKTFILTANPETATGYYSNEVTFLRKKGYSFESYSSMWKAVK